MLFPKDFEKILKSSILLKVLFPYLKIFINEIKIFFYSYLLKNY